MWPQNEQQNKTKNSERQRWSSEWGLKPEAPGSWDVYCSMLFLKGNYSILDMFTYITETQNCLTIRKYIKMQLKHLFYVHNKNSKPIFKKPTIGYILLLLIFLLAFLMLTCNTQWQKRKNNGINTINVKINFNPLI